MKKHLNNNGQEPNFFIDKKGLLKLSSKPDNCFSTVDNVAVEGMNEVVQNFTQQNNLNVIEIPGSYRRQWGIAHYSTDLTVLNYYKNGKHHIALWGLHSRALAKRIRVFIKNRHSFQLQMANQSLSADQLTFNYLNIDFL